MRLPQPISPAAAGSDIVGRLGTDLGGPAKLANRHDEGSFQHAATVEILDQCRQRVVEDGAAVFAQRGEIVAVRVP